MLKSVSVEQDTPVTSNQGSLSGSNNQEQLKAREAMLDSRERILNNKEESLKLKCQKLGIPFETLWGESEY